MILPKFFVHRSGEKGFTLIELLVVIAVLGILASVVLVAINPAERTREARDAGKRSDVSQTATAVEACFTAAATGNYGTCNDIAAELVTKGYLKTTPASVTVEPAGAGTPANVAVFAALEAESAGTCASVNYWVYCSNDGDSNVVCKASTPTAAVDCP